MMERVGLSKFSVVLCRIPNTQVRIKETIL